MAYRFEKLRILYQDMLKEKKMQEKFKFQINKVIFEAIFLADRHPFELLIGVKEHQFAFVLQVRQTRNGFITELPDNIYYRICDILKLSWSKDHFSSYAFFQRVDAAIPHCCSNNSVEPHEIAYYKKRDIAEDEKIYFCGWNDHIADGRKARNFGKTRLLLGDAIAEFCRKNNISSMWTDVKKERMKYGKPPGFNT